MAWLTPPLNILALLFWHFGTCLAIGFPLVTLAGKRLNWSVLKEESCWMSSQPLLFFGTLCGPLPVFPAQPYPQPGEWVDQEGPDSQPDRSSAEGALSQCCTQCVERILFLGFCVWVESSRWCGRRSTYGLIRGVFSNPLVLNFSFFSCFLPNFSKMLIRFSKVYIKKEKL